MARPKPDARGPLGLITPGETVQRGGLLVVLVLLVAFFGYRYDNFFTFSNGITTAVNISAIAIVSVGAMALLIAGYVDLSIGSMFGLVSVTVALVARDTQNPLLAVVVGVIAGVVLGGLNGLLVWRLPVSPLIVTLALLLVYSGLAYAITDGNPVYGFPDAFIGVGRDKLAGVPVPVIIAGVLYVVGAALLTWTVVGLRVYAMGGNPDAARVQGVNTGRYLVALYAVNGALVGVVAVLSTARLGSGAPNLGTNFELDVLTAVILGGIAFNGGSGRPLGVLYGVATIGVLDAGLLFAGLQSWYQDIAKGAVLLLALIADQVAIARRDRQRDGAPAASRIDEAAEGIESLLRGSLRGARSTGAEREPVLACQGLRLSYGSVSALRSAGLSVARGEVVCLVGDNGAGKSSLIKILSGVVRPGGGVMSISGETVRLVSPADARRRGVQTVYQDLALCPNLGVAHNLVLGAEPRRRLWGLLPVRDDREAVERSQGSLRALGIHLPDVRRPVRLLSGGQRQSVAIARALRPDVRVAVLDEPTAALGVRQTQQVLRVVRNAAERGAGVLLISHDIETIFAIADRIAVLRLGQIVHEGPADDLDEVQLLRLMAGLETTSATAD